MIIERKPPRYPRQGPSCLLVLFVLFGIVVGGFIIQNADEVRDVIIPTPTPEPTRSATEYALLATFAIDENSLDEAITYYEEAIRLDATKPQFYIDLVNLLVETGRPEEALSWAADAAILAPENEAVWTAYAAAHLANGDRLAGTGDINAANLQYAEAVQQADKALSINPQNATALAYSAGGLVLQGNAELYEQAQLRAEEATFLDPENADARYYLATVYTNQGFYDAAREQWQLGIQAAPNRSDLHMGLAYNFFADGRIPDAILSFNAALEVDPENAEAYDGLAYMYLQLGQYPQAEENAQQAIALDPTLARAYGRLGEAFYVQNNYERAVEALTQATALYGEPNALNARFFFYLANSYLRQGPSFCSQAVPLFEQVSQISFAFQESAQEGLVECRRAALEQSPN